MFATARHQICKLTTQRPPRNGAQLQTVRQNHTSTSNSRIRSPALVLGAVASTGIVAAYFFWPDPSRGAPTYLNALISPAHFTPTILTSSEQCLDPETRLITLTVPPRAIPSLDIFRPIWSVYIKDDDIQVERPYTPLEGIDSEGRMKLWVKRYPKGEVGRWLHSKRAGDKIEIRGPLMTWMWQEGKWDEVVMISGGTGITPFYQLLHHTILKNPTQFTNTRFTLLHSSRRPAELPPSDILDPLLSAAQAAPEHLAVSLFVDSLEGASHPSVAPPGINVGRINEKAIRHALGSESASGIWQRVCGWIRYKQNASRPRSERILFLVCGPEPMITAIAGPFGRNYSQGDVGGALGVMGYGRGQVWKLC